MNAPRPATSDFSFFSKSKTSKPTKTTTTVTVTKRVVAVKKAASPADAPGPSGTVHVVARDGTPASQPSLKREPDAAVVPARVKRQRSSATPSVEPPSRASSSVPAARSTAPTRDVSPRPRRSRSPSASAVSTPEPLDTTSRPARVWWTEEDGRLGADFVNYEDVIRDNMKDYTSYFKNPDDPSDTSFEPHPTSYPVVELEFPNTGACERFALLIPKDSDLYTPLQSLESSLYTILEYYLTPEQRSLFGTMPNDRLHDSTDDDPPVAAPSPAASSSHEAFHSTVSTPSSDSSASSVSSSSSTTSISSVSSATSVASSVSSLSCISDLQHFASPSYSGPPCVDYLKLFHRALHRRDGPLFLRVMDAINALLRAFKYPTQPIDPYETTLGNSMRENVRSWAGPSIPDKIISQILGEAYDRTVRPNFHLLKSYSAWSSEVYGELLPPFIVEIMRVTGLKQGMLFADFGSGVGNVLLQTSLATGCRSYGIEIMPTPARVAREQLKHFQDRCRMWGLRMGSVELEEGDMLASQRADEVIRQADVVLVNNERFDETLNDALKAKFLDLKEGAFVVSLRSFQHSSSHINDIGNIFEVKEKRYRDGDVSWTGKGGTYWLHRVNRKRALTPQTSSGRPSRSTRSSRR